MVLHHYRYTPNTSSIRQATGNRLGSAHTGTTNGTSGSPGVQENPMWAACVQQQRQIVARQTSGSQGPQIPLLSNPNLSRAPPSFGPSNSFGPSMSFGPGTSFMEPPRMDPIMNNSLPEEKSEDGGAYPGTMKTDLGEGMPLANKPQPQMYKKNLRLFLQGNQKSLIDCRGNYNVHRRIPRATKLYLSWMHDTFPSLLRLRWSYLWLLVLLIYMVTISLFALIIWVGDRKQQCVSDVAGYADAFFFVVQTFFTIGYGVMAPVCYWTHSLVTVIVLVGMVQHTALTGIVFAKFSLSQSRDLSCAFSTRLFAVEDGEDEQVLRLCFRFVNVFHRHFFHVQMRLFLVEHVQSPDPEEGDAAFVPLVEELHYFDTSVPLEFMSLPVEVCAYVPYARLITPEMMNGGAISPSSDPTQTVRHTQKWVRYFSRDYKHTLDYMQKQAQTQPKIESKSDFKDLDMRETSKDTRDTNEAETPKHPARSVTRERLNTMGIDGEELLRASEFELVCTLEFTDATTGAEIAVRKSWPLCNMLWDSTFEGGLAWKNIVRRIGDSGAYVVDVARLDELEGFEMDSSSNADLDYPTVSSEYVPPAHPQPAVFGLSFPDQRKRPTRLDTFDEGVHESEPQDGAATPTFAQATLKSVQNASAPCIDLPPRSNSNGGEGKEGYAPVTPYAVSTPGIARRHTESEDGLFARMNSRTLGGGGAEREPRRRVIQRYRTSSNIITGRGLHNNSGNNAPAATPKGGRRAMVPPRQHTQMWGDAMRGVGNTSIDECLV